MINKIKIIIGFIMTMPFVLRPIAFNMYATLASILIAIIGALIALDGLEKSI